MQELVKRRLERNGCYFKFLLHDIRLVRHVLERNGFIDVEDMIYGDVPSQPLFLWSSQLVKQSVFQNLQRHQKINHFPRSYEITRKDLFYQRMSRMIALHGERAFDYVPKTYQYP
jgi:tubulin polyglutamylase TTLL5